MDPNGICTFFLKVGACRHGDVCTKAHIPPQTSQTILLPHLWCAEQRITIEDQQRYEQFYETVYNVCSTYGQVVDLIVSENQAPHLKGNVLVKYADDSMALSAVEGMRGQSFYSVIVQPSLVGVNDLRESRCKQHDLGDCPKHGVCNYLHVIPIPNQFHAMESFNVQTNTKREKRLSWETRQYQRLDKSDDNRRRRSRSRSLERRRRSRSRSYSRERSHTKRSTDLDYLYISYQEQCSLIGEYPPPNVPLYTDVYSMPH